MDEKEIETIMSELPQWLRPGFETWLAVRPPFKIFACENVDKIRSKLRRSRDDQDKADVLTELEIAYRLLAFPACHLVYEPYGRSGKRNPDFLVKAESCQYHLEIKRIREPQKVIDARNEAFRNGKCYSEIPFTQKESFKFSDHITDCLEQFRAGGPNVLAVMIHSSTHEAIEMDWAMQVLRRYPGDESYFRKKVLTGSWIFLRSFGA